MTGIDIRPLRTRTEREACLRLQEETWGPDFADRVPASVLMIALETGGIASGAFEEGHLVGFVFGITGLRDGSPVHWSDMLAVHPSHRGRGIGHRLKLHQRQELLDRGVRTMLWTFDPLEARNAHLNLNRLGAVVRTYRRDLYGDSASPLHAGFGTDRLLAEWQLDSERTRSRIGEAGPPASGGAPVGGDDESAARAGHTDIGGAGEAPFLHGWRPGNPHPAPGRDLAPPVEPVVRLSIPADIQALKRDDMTLAREWRSVVRSGFEDCFRAGYVAVALQRGTPACNYVLVRGLTR